MIGIDKTTPLEQAIGKINDGDTVMVGGFGIPGTPFCLLDELVRQGQKGLTVIKNDANKKNLGVDRLLENGSVKKLIVTHIGLNPNAVEMMNDKQIEVEFCPQGILAERVRAAGAGLFGFLTDVGIDSDLAKGKQTIEQDGRVLLVENALSADHALIHGDSADTFGNVTYAASARNFNPLMAMAADHTIVETENLRALGDIEPTQIHTPGPFVDAVVKLEALSKDYDVYQP